MFQFLIISDLIVGWRAQFYYLRFQYEHHNDQYFRFETQKDILVW